MKHLAKLSPAETLVVLQDRKATISELLKITFMDLLLKQVLRTFEIQKQPNKKDPIRIYKYVGVGKNFATYQALPHENAFLAPFQKSNTAEFLFRHVVKMAYQNAVAEDTYQNRIIKCAGIANCFKRNLLQMALGGFSMTAHGLSMRTELQAELAQLEIELPELIHSDHQRASDMLKVIKGNIFLLSNIDWELLKQIDKELLEELNKRNHNDSYGGCTGCTWSSFDSDSDTFDSSCSGDSGSDGGSGCGSGCSGCGGCGGCGG